MRDGLGDALCQRRLVDRVEARTQRAVIKAGREGQRIINDLDLSLWEHILGDLDEARNVGRRTAQIEAARAIQAAAQPPG